MSIRSQLLKGILEGCILAVVDHQAVYGYELSLKLQGYGLFVSEGSIYPVLLRLQKEKLLEGQMQSSPAGPNRKYYYLTKAGTKALDDFRVNWEAIKQPVEQLLHKED